MSILNESLASESQGSETLMTVSSEYAACIGRCGLPIDSPHDVQCFRPRATTRCQSTALAALGTSRRSMKCRALPESVALAQGRHLRWPKRPNRLAERVSSCKLHFLHNACLAPSLAPRGDIEGGSETSCSSPLPFHAIVTHFLLPFPSQQANQPLTVHPRLNTDIYIHLRARPTRAGTECLLDSTRGEFGRVERGQSADECTMTTHAPMARVPFAPLDNPRLQHLASAKNRQNGMQIGLIHWHVSNAHKSRPGLQE